MKKFLSLAGALLAFAGANIASAIPIVGTAEISGVLELNDDVLGDASAALGGTGTVSLTSTGHYSSTAGAAVSFAGFSWNPSSTPVEDLWSFSSGGWTYSFDLLSLNVLTHSATFLDISGTGLLFIEGAGSPFDAEGTVGTWTFQINNSAGSHPEALFQFTSSNTSVPDGGTTAALLGLGLVGLGAISRRRRATV